ncbi:MAG: hypothetical protein EA349_08945 [Halomonadaceae bacterium]|nr:MAG: hypothetical protein EA349_08945 [Halomonadaceae bacterium]
MANAVSEPDKKPQKKRFFAFLTQTEIPIAVYLAIFSTMAVLWIFQTIHEELTLGLFTELLGAAFTLFIIDTLLVRAKTHRWQVVRKHVDYLIGRNVNRLRDGLVTRVFGFDPAIDSSLSEVEMNQVIRRQRGELLNFLEQMTEAELLQGADESSLFSEEFYDYFNERAGDLWDIINMKYSEYMAPELVSVLIRLHTQMKDVCGHVRQYRKAQRFPQYQSHYQQVGRMGMSVSLLAVIAMLNQLKNEGYSEAASLAGEFAEPVA